MIITRYHNMEELRLTVEFLTPTFLGGADQNAELRAAPFKNLLRQWWRVAVGSRYATPETLLAAEGDLFGSVLDENEASTSRVRLALTPVEVRLMSHSKDFVSTSRVRLALTPVEGSFLLSEKGIFFGKTPHPEVKGGMAVENALYLGFGPITLKNSKRYIAPGSKANLLLSFPREEKVHMVDLLHYIDAFGTIGSRSRNGWGSLSLSGEGFARKDVRSFATAQVSHLVSDKQGKQYPSLLGADSKGLLCWEVGVPKGDWTAAMQSLAETYMTLRTKINIKPQGLKERHLLGYPVTNHSLTEWGGNNGRMPSQLRLMVKRSPEDQLVGRILHLPHCLPEDKPWKNSLGPPFEIWKSVHALLDANKHFHRCGGAQ